MRSRGGGDWQDWVSELKRCSAAADGESLAHAERHPARRAPQMQAELRHQGGLRKPWQEVAGNPSAERREFARRGRWRRSGLSPIAEVPWPRQLTRDASEATL